ncbi:MAG: NAD(P)-binding domain-containing protein [Sulfuricaulis sp.]
MHTSVGYASDLIGEQTVDAQTESLLAGADVVALEFFPPAKCLGHLTMQPGQIVSDLVHGPALVVVDSGSVTVEQHGRPRYVTGWSLVVLRGNGLIKLASTHGATLTWITLEPVAKSNDFNDDCYVCDLALFRDVAHMLGGVSEVTSVHGYDLGIRIAQIDTVSEWRPLISAPKHRFIGTTENTENLVAELVYRQVAPPPSRVFNDCLDLAIIGAGPTGMSVAAHAKTYGLDYVILGEPWAFWHRHMIPLPLRSPAATTNIDTPRRGCQFLDFARLMKLPEAKRIAFHEFIAYATWFAAQHELRPIQLAVQTVHRDDDCWLIRTQGGVVRARHVVVAVGLNGMQRMPEEAARHPRLYTTVSEIKCFEELRGKRVAIVGAGQSAAEAALALAAAGAQTQLVVRGERVVFRSLHSPGAFLFKFLFKRTDRFISWLPARLQTILLRFLTKGTIEPTLRDELDRAGVQIHTRSRIVPAVRGGENFLEMRSPGGKPVPVDYAVLGTGYTFDVRRIPFLSDVSVKHVDGIPRLNRYAESSAPRLYFCGIATLRLIGPQAQFIFGTSKISPRIIAGIRRRRGQGNGR